MLLLTRPAVKTRPLALLPRGTGSKRRHIPVLEPVLASAPFDTVVESFGGGLWLTQALHQAKTSTIERIIVAETMVDLRSIYRAWSTPEWRPQIAAHILGWQVMPIEHSWPLIKSAWEKAQTSNRATPLAAAAGLALRILTFSGIVRDSQGSGELNIKWNKAQQPRWHPRLRRFMAGHPTGEVIKFPHPHLVEWLASTSDAGLEPVPGFLQYKFAEYGYLPTYPARPKNLLVYKDFSHIKYPGRHPS